MKYWMKMYMTFKGIPILMLVFWLLSCPGPASGQITINSPYTRYGLGNLVENGLDPRTTAMGGLHYGLQRSDLINSANPASYAAFDSVSFLFDAGLFGNLVTLKTASLTNQGSYISLSHLLFGFPITKWWKTSFGVLPFSYVGYDIFNTEKLDDTLMVTYVYRGSGGLNQLYWGSGFSIGKKFSAGFNIKYLFGNISRSRGATFPDSTEMKNSYITGSMRPSDLYAEIGVQYKTALPENHFLVAGATFGPEVKINAKASTLATTYFGIITSPQLYYDTIDVKPVVKGSFTLPARAGVGVSAGKSGKWMAGADFSWQNWEKYTYFGESDSLLNRWSVHVGGDYIPDDKSTSTYFQRVQYRLGFYYMKTPLNLKNKHLDELGMSFGLGLPLRRSKSTVNLSLIMGKRGTTEMGLIQENFIRFTVGVNVHENWFFKTKYF